jgi:pimeloyl-ACP methyl ester carboxylesterase
VLFVDGALIAGTFRPLLAEAGLLGRYRPILYHRRGYGGSSRGAGTVSVARQAADCGALLRHLGLERAHVVGHSYGGAIALQLAMDSPGVVHSLALLEPGLMVGASAQGYRESLARGAERYREAGAAVVVEEFLEARWPEYRTALEQALAGAFAQAVADAGTWFEREMPGLLGWRFDEADARRISQPTLSVLGGESDALASRFGETHRLLLAWLPQAEGVVLPGATHLMQLEDPRGLAEVLTAFWARRRLPAGAALRRGKEAVIPGSTSIAQPDLASGRSGPWYSCRLGLTDCGAATHQPELAPLCRPLTS